MLLKVIHKIFLFSIPIIVTGLPYGQVSIFLKNFKLSILFYNLITNLWYK